MLYYQNNATLDAFLTHPDFRVSGTFSSGGYKYSTSLST